MIVDHWVLNISLMLFKNRQEAGVKLAEKLKEYRGKDTVVYAMPRGGVVLAFEIVKRISAPLDLIITRKIGHPYNPEYAVCAIAEDGEMICNETERALLDREWLAEQAQKEQQEAFRRRKIYLANSPHISASGKTAILVDDGIATGLTIRAAIHSLKRENPKELIVAVPVVPHDTVEVLKKEADKVVVLEDAIAYLGAVGAYYGEFFQVADEEVIDIMKQARALKRKTAIFTISMI